MIWTTQCLRVRVYWYWTHLLLLSHVDILCGITCYSHRLKVFLRFKDCSHLINLTIPNAIEFNELRMNRSPAFLLLTSWRGFLLTFPAPLRTAHTSTASLAWRKWSCCIDLAPTSSDFKQKNVFLFFTLTKFATLVHYNLFNSFILF